MKVVLWYLLVINFLCWFIDEWRKIRDILNSIKANHEETSGFYMLHCLIILQILAVQYCFHYFKLMFCVLCWFFENNCIGDGTVAQIFCPMDRLSLCSGVENSPFQKKNLGVCPGDCQTWNPLIHNSRGLLNVPCQFSIFVNIFQWINQSNPKFASTRWSYEISFPLYRRKQRLSQ